MYSFARPTPTAVADRIFISDTKRSGDCSSDYRDSLRSILFDHVQLERMSPSPAPLVVQLASYMHFFGANR